MRIGSSCAELSESKSAAIKIFDLVETFVSSVLNIKVIRQISRTGIRRQSDYTPS